ncbi:MULTISPECIES: hypothetical protein [Acetobacter]|jgi:hypothetical protein|uniref:Uncharacterized protein n=2 Tax=Acetobacter peroxydans TaxID=104098 RepID=A0A4Y3TV20_9PROT|nr:hypothetical protein [Acetobacter peroxydans]MCH4142699.1 hypothetical protein [Acetobacter peroxydans]MCI1395448.1 hypothetical protein [Acetobacter peroxydans]MCI1411057.1 hypothetical protein [Acetobacter peroxydans]MCI1724289.1 hypothetical protein [Acetobacter peroxydans]MCI1767586.1 hypothetical protein [Acetobacter peroxydans]
MARFIFGRVSLMFCGMAVAGLGFLPVAHAQRVISDLEASKLTFAALTAPPPVIHHHIRVAHHSSTAHVVSVAHAGKAHSMVHLVSYHAPKHAVHGKKAHHRT